MRRDLGERWTEPYRRDEGGVWLGWRFHGSLEQRQIYRICYGLLVVTALKLLWDGVAGYLA